MKSVRIRSFSDPYFPALDFGTQDSRMIQTFLIQSEYGHFSGMLDAGLLIVIMEKT